MGGHLRRLASTGAAYTASSIVAKLIAVALLPIYTRALEPADYGAAEVLLVSVIATSIFVRFGVIEAILRFYHQAEEDRTEVIRTAFASLLWTTTAGALVALALAGPISEAVLDRSDPGLVRISVLGLWAFTLYEFLLVLMRLDERPRAYFRVTVANVLLTVALTVTLVVGLDEGARGLLLGNYLATTAFLLGLLVANRHRLGLVPDRPLLRRMVAFGLPTMPAELSLYALQFIDRILLVRLAGLAEAGLYALAIKFSQGVTVIVRGFQLAWPPLAYSITDDGEARQTYALIVSWFLAFCAGAVLGLSLIARWVVDLLAAPEYFEAWEAIPLLSTGVTLYALYLVLVVMIGRSGRTGFNFPVAAVATAVNIGLNIALIPSLEIVGAGIALVASYLVMLVLMFAVTRRVFPVDFEWRRIATVLLLAGGMYAGGELLLPDDGALGLAARVGVAAAYAPLLWTLGFFTPEERRALRALPEHLANRTPDPDPAVEAARRDDDATGPT